jgi:hypothetical protein
LFSKGLKEDLRIAKAGLSNLNTSVESVYGEILQEKSQVAFICILETSPAVDIGMGC